MVLTKGTGTKAIHGNFLSAAQGRFSAASRGTWQKNNNRGGRPSTGQLGPFLMDTGLELGLDPLISADYLLPPRRPSQSLLPSLEVRPRSAHGRQRAPHSS